MEHSSELSRPSCFRESLPIIFYLRYRIEQVECVPLAFLSHFCADILVVPFRQVDLYRYNKLFISFDDLNVRWLMVNYYVCSRMFSKHVKKQKVSNFQLKLT